MVMNLKETIISSFFFHLILFLLMLAVSSYTTGFAGGLQKIVSVDLAMEDSKAIPAAGIGSEDEPLPVSGTPADEKVSLSDPAVENPPEETKKAEPEKKAEAITDPAKVENMEKPPVQAGGFTSLAAYYQFVMLHKKIFVQKAGARVNELIGEALKENKRIFYGGTAVVSLKFAPDGKLSGVLVDSASPELKAFLEEVGWTAVPAPAAYSLRDTGVQIEFTVLEGYLNFNIKAF